jgi:2-(1,2-epoxy-1,2-dihydrophenyl)acetyl-CoA isomerase
MAFSTITLDINDGLAHLTLNRPEAANALNRAMGVDLRDAAIELYHRGDVRAVLLSSTGKVFCGGGDLASFAQQGDDLPAYIDQVTIDFHAAMSRLAKMDAPLVAAVAGSVGGAGMSLVSACDLVVAGESCKFTMGYTRAGMVPDGTSSFFLARAVGLRRAMDLVLTNRVLTCAEAEDWGLVNRVVPDEELDAAVDDLMARATRGSRASKGWGKQTLYAQLDRPERDAYGIAVEVMAAASQLPGAQEWTAAFLEKRRPVWTD